MKKNSLKTAMGSGIALSICALLGIAACSGGTSYVGPDESVYALLNIPYEEFYASEGVGNKTESDTGHVNVRLDALSSATNKTGNYGKSGGAYHSEATAQIAADGTVTAVGGANGATNRGVTWPVRVSSLEALQSLGGDEITDDTAVTVATLGQGRTSFTNLSGFQCITESKTYSYYVLPSKPEYYKELTVSGGKASFSATKGSVSSDSSEATATYGGHYADIAVNPNVSDLSDRQINAVIITSKDSSGAEKTAGLVHLYNVWAATEIGLNGLEGLEPGNTITNIRVFSNNKESDSAKLAYTVTDYAANLALLPKFTGTVTATFDSDSQISLVGWPSDAGTTTALVYHTTGGRNAVLTYLTPLAVDPADGDIDPQQVTVTSNKIAISATLQTVTSGSTSKTYGQPASGTEYTIVLTSENYAPVTITTTR